MTKKQMLELIEYKLAKLKLSDLKDIKDVIVDDFNYRKSVAKMDMTKTN